jgi:Trk K+ transport system NAD-binding subunit
MAKTSDLDRVAMVVLRFMRGPIFLLIAVYALGITGMAIIPGREINGEITYMSFFHALYFMTYTATTTGFGELPGEFSDAQRMWAIACLYMSVVAWFYSIGTIIRLVQNPHFRQALAQYRFAIGVKRITDPFVIICGFGDTGSLLARGLSDQFITGVLIDIDEERIKALNLRDYRLRMPGLCGDASVPKQLLDAGLRRPNCQAVVALTSDEDANLKIAVMTRILNPQARIICRSSSRSHVEELRMLGSISVLDPFETFARQLCTALHSPALHTLDEWLIGAPGVNLNRVLGYPVGIWIVCGYGRMGRWLCESLQARGVPTVVISPDIPDQNIPGTWIRGYANKQTLEQAGAGGVAGVVAATNSDSANLRIVRASPAPRARARLRRSCGSPRGRRAWCPRGAGSRLPT